MEAILNMEEVKALSRITTLFCSLSGKIQDNLTEIVIQLKENSELMNITV